VWDGGGGGGGGGGDPGESRLSISSDREHLLARGKKRIRPDSLTKHRGECARRNLTVSSSEDFTGSKGLRRNQRCGIYHGTLDIMRRRGLGSLAASKGEINTTTQHTLSVRGRYSALTIPYLLKTKRRTDRFAIWGSGRVTWKDGEKQVSAFLQHFRGTSRESKGLERTRVKTFLGWKISLWGRCGVFTVRTERKVNLECVKTDAIGTRTGSSACGRRREGF